jgi:hypothetical protein
MDVESAEEAVLHTCQPSRAYLLWLEEYRCHGDNF